MAVRLRNLNESLEKLYESSNTSLTEAFDDSFPKWLKDRLVDVRKFHGTDKNTDRDINAVPRANRPSYTSPRGWYGNDKDLGLFNGLLKKGVDLQNFKVIEGPVPEKRTDERLKSPNVPIWHFPNGQVYIPGINDNEETTIVPGKEMAYKYVPIKYLVANADAFAYFDENQLGTEDTYSKTRLNRLEKSKELKKMGYGRQGKDPAQFVPNKPYRWSRDEEAHFDKSGYLVDPKIYKDKLADIKAANYSVELEKVYNAISEYRDDISTAMQYYDPFENVNEYNSLQNSMDTLKWAAKKYNDTASRIKQIAEDVDMSEENKRYYIKRYMQDLKDYSYIERVMEGSDIFLSGANWLE